MANQQSAQHTPGPQKQVRIAGYTYLVQRGNEGTHSVRVLCSDGVWRKSTSERQRTAAIYAYSALLAKATGDAA